MGLVLLWLVPRILLVCLHLDFAESAFCGVCWGLCVICGRFEFRLCELIFRLVVFFRGFEGGIYICILSYSWNLSFCFWTCDL